MAIGTGVEEERATATTIAPAKQRTWQQWQRWKESKVNSKGKWNIDSDGDNNSHKNGILDGDCEGDSTWNGYGEGGGGEGRQIILF